MVNIRASSIILLIGVAFASPSLLSQTSQDPGPAVLFVNSSASPTTDREARAVRQTAGGIPQTSRFWRDSIGWWASDNTYLNGKLEQTQLAAYQSIVHIEAKGELLVETTYKFYPPGDASKHYSEGRVGAEQGVELITVNTMRAIDDDGAVETLNVSPVSVAQPGRMITTPLSATVALQRKEYPESGLADYHTIITLPTPDRRYTAIFGIYTGQENDNVVPGDLRGLALFAGKRIAVGEVEELRASLRRLNSVGAVVSSDPEGRSLVKMLD